MNVALIGSVSSSWYTLEALIRAGVEITGVLGVDESQAARISDYHSLREPATRAGIPFFSFVKVTEPAVEEFLRAHPPDLLWVIGLSQLVPPGLLAIARQGGVGFHPTMLPEGRGRAPVAWTILRGARAAANLFFLADEPDAGDIIIQREVLVLPDDYSEELIRRTNEVLAAAIIELAPALKAGKLPRRPQDHSRATYYPKRTPADGLIDWSQPTEMVYRLIRAAGRPYPGAFSHLRGRQVTIRRARPAAAGEMRARGVAPAPGTVLRVQPQGVLVQTGDGGLWLTEWEDGAASTAPAGASLVSGARFTSGAGLV
ncbi:MAG TPA: methionyl-tRNA formyltransferase [Phycisphaerae bacterium]|nr:methionyl-tRNA formyltransferase [Phycisphaerae bacterium]HNU45465.1 methionyl-tRNA formyltransferase [Phycisphaerae bacterium]